MTLSIVIVSYNVRHYLAQCLWSVQRAIQGMDAEVWVVDNASSDDTVSYLRQDFPWVHVVANEVNEGFARANNQAIRQSQSRYVLLLNPDTVVGEDVLSACVTFLDNHPEAGATGVRMLNRDGAFANESRRGLPTPSTAFYKMIGLCAAFPRHRVFGRYYMGYLNEDEPSLIEVMSGAYCMVRRTALEQVGLLDEDYFMYGEDIDLSYRLMQAGWQNWYLPLSILHYKGESTQTTSFRYVQIFYDAMLIFFEKHFAYRYRLFSLIIRLAVHTRAALAYAVRALSKSWRRLKTVLHLTGCKRRVAEAPESLVFVGSDASWQSLLEVASQAGLQAIRAGHDGNPDEKPLYTVSVPSERSNKEILEAHRQQALSGQPTFIGFYHPEHRLLVLPNDIFEYKT